MDIAGPAGPIRVRLEAPRDTGRWPAVLFYSDIFQNTAPHLRLARRLADRGFVVVSPEIYGRIEPIGTVLDFEKDRQRALDDSGKVRVEDVDADRAAVLDWIAARPDVDASHICVVGFCFGGHLAFRAAYEPRVSAVACCYPTTVHAEKLGASEHVDTLSRAKELKAPLLLIWGSRDPHIPVEGRAKIERTLTEAGARFETRSFDAEHAFMRDEGPRYAPDATAAALDAIVAHLAR